MTDRTDTDTLPPPDATGVPICDHIDDTPIGSADVYTVATVRRLLAEVGRLTDVLIDEKLKVTRLEAERDALLADAERVPARIIRDLEAAAGGVEGVIFPPGQPGSYARGQHNGMLDALRIVHAALDAARTPEARDA